MVTGDLSFLKGSWVFSVPGRAEFCLVDLVGWIENDTRSVALKFRKETRVFFD